MYENSHPIDRYKGMLHPVPHFPVRNRRRIVFLREACLDQLILEEYGG